MKISDNTINFKSGLTQNVRRLIKNSDSKAIESAFGNYGVDAKFDNNKILASFFAITLNIFEELSEKYKLPFSALPPRIRAFSRKDLIKKTFSDCFCLPDSGEVLKKELPFELRSIFIKKESNLTVADKKVETAFLQGERSSSHFLSNTIHEWSHNIHLDLIYKKFGYDGICPFGKELYPKFFPLGLKLVEHYGNWKPNRKIQSEIQRDLGEYAAKANSKMEIFAEGITKLIADSLDETTLAVKQNPLDKLKNFSKSVRKIIENTLE